MTGMGEVWLGIDWSGKTPAARLALAGSSGPARLMPLNEPLRFRVLQPSIRYCAGWFDLNGHDGKHIVCDAWEKLRTGRQCATCQRREGFLVAHQGFQASLDQMPFNLRKYLSQPHRLYVDIFPDGSAKVGTVAERRLYARLAEQGPVAAYYVARTEDGLAARRLEAAVSRQLQLPQAVTTKRKLHGLTTKIDVPALRTRLLEVATRAGALTADLAQAGCGWSPISPPEQWQVPAVSGAVFDATPLMPYPEPLTSGQHSLYLCGISGSIGAFTVTPDRDDTVYVANLGQLNNLAVEFGNFQSEVACQSVLF